jgi:carbonic anhydrase
VLSRSTPADAVELLKAGNMRFLTGESQRAPYGPHIADFAGDSHPFAAVLGCSDARVPIEIIFDQGPGELFVVRIAGNFVNSENLASIEFAVDILKASVVLVLGHSRCGAVRATLANVLDGTSQRGHIPEIIDAIMPSVQAARGFPGNWLENAIAHNVARNVKAITAESNIVSDAVDAGEVEVIGGIYDVTTGWVAFT